MPPCTSPITTASTKKSDTSSTKYAKHVAPTYTASAMKMPLRAPILPPSQPKASAAGNATNVAASAGYQANDHLWVGGRVMYNQYAIPDYAVSATNLDFTNIGGMLGVRYKLVGPVSFGVAYTKFFPKTRTITTSAWDVRDEDDAYYVDEYLSPKSPYKAAANG